MLTGTQVRMARAALKLGVRELAERAQVSPNTVTRVESEQPSNPATLAAIRNALEQAGVEFIPSGPYQGEGGAGVRLKAS